MAEGLPVLTFGAEAAGPGEIALDLDRLVTSRLLVSATSGGGKSWMLRSLLEGTHGRIQQVVVDWEGEFASLRERFDYLLVGGEGADLPARPETAATLMRRLLELGASAILDLSDLAVEDRRACAAAALGELMRVPRSLWRPLLVAIDEAHLLCPEAGQGESEARQAVLDLCSAGRKRGFCAVLATQRLAKVSNSALAELRNVLIGPTTFQPDVKRAAEQLGFDRRQSQGLKTLEAGQFYAVGPALSREVVLLRSGAVLTTHPEPGQVVPPAPPAPEAIRALLEQLADVAETPAPSAGTPASDEDLEALREARDLRQQVEDLNVYATEIEGELERVRWERDGLKAQLGTLQDGRKLHNLAGVALAISNDADRLRMALEELAARVLDPSLACESAVSPAAGSPEPDDVRPEAGCPPASPLVPVTGSLAAADVSPASAAAIPDTVPRGTPGAPYDREARSNEEAVLDAIVTLRRLGMAPADRRAVAALAGLGALDLAALEVLERTVVRGLTTICRDDTVMGLTPRGARLAWPMGIETLEAYQEHWLWSLSRVERELAELLLARPDQPRLRSGLAAAMALAIEGSTFRGAAARLRALGIAEAPETGTLQASWLLFPPSLTPGRADL